MQKNEGQKKSLALISAKTFYPIYFKKKLEEYYYISFLEGDGFELKDLKFIFADVVVIDDKSFGENIFKVVTQIRRMSHYHDKPIIVITSKLKKSYINLLIKAGANDFIREPLDDQDVMDTLKDVEKYHEVSSKMHAVAGKMNPSKSDEEKNPLKDRFFLNKVTLRPIHRSLKEGGCLVVLCLSVDKSERLSTEGFEEMIDYIKYSLQVDDLLFSVDFEHLLIICNNTSAKKGFMIAESLKDDVRSKEFSSHEGKELFTLSIGMAAQKKPPYQDIREMIEDANSAQKEAEKTGNQVIIHTRH